MKSALKQRVVQHENINPAVNQQRAINGEGLLQVMSGVVDISTLRAVVEDAGKENFPPSSIRVLTDKERAEEDQSKETPSTKGDEILTSQWCGDDEEIVRGKDI